MSSLLLLLGEFRGSLIKGAKKILIITLIYYGWSAYDVSVTDRDGGGVYPCCDYETWKERFVSIRFRGNFCTTHFLLRLVERFRRLLLRLLERDRDLRRLDDLLRRERLLDL